MSRSGYSYGDNQWDLIRWRGAVASAIRGKRGQAFLREMLTALDAMPEKRLIANGVVCADGVCAMGAVAKARGIGPERFADPNGYEVHSGQVDPYDREAVASLLGIAEALAAEIAYENDEAVYYKESPEHRWQRMREWVVGQLADRSQGDGREG